MNYNIFVNRQGNAIISGILTNERNDHKFVVTGANIALKLPPNKTQWPTCDSAQTLRYPVL